MRAYGRPWCSLVKMVRGAGTAPLLFWDTYDDVTIKLGKEAKIMVKKCILKVANVFGLLGKGEPEIPYSIWI